MQGKFACGVASDPPRSYRYAEPANGPQTIMLAAVPYLPTGNRAWGTGEGVQIVFVSISAVATALRSTNAGQLRIGFKYLLIVRLDDDLEVR